MLSFVLNCCVAVAGAQAVAGATPVSEQIVRAIHELGAPSFEARQAATDLLWKAGEAAEAALHEAAKSTDPEVRTRANALLARLRLGIRPETPPEVTALIDQFRYAESTALRRQALTELQSKGHWQAILALLRDEHSPEERRGLATVIAGEAGKLVRPLVERGDLDQAEQVLELVSLSEAGISQLTAFLVLTGRLDARIAAAQAAVVAAPHDEDWLRLAYLLRAKGDLSAAIDAAGKTTDLFVQANFFAEARRWDDAAAVASELFRRHPTRLETAAFAATFYRLAGKEAEQQKTIEALLKAANIERLIENGQPNKPPDPFGAPTSNVGLTYAWTAAETLLVNERFDESLPILKKINPRFAHALLARQQRHAEALEFVGALADKPLDRAWFDNLPALGGDDGARQEGQIALAGQVARELRELGLKEQLDSLLAVLHGLSAPMGDRGRRMATQAALNFQLGRHDEAIRDAAAAIAAGWPPASVFAGMLKQQGPLAAAWHAQHLAGEALADRTKSLEQSLWMVAAQPPHGKLPENWRELVKAAGAAAEKLAPPQKAQRLLMLGQTCQVRGDAVLAKQYFGKAAAADPAAAMKAADLALGDKQWRPAAELYAKTANSDALAAYLQGYCLVQAGDAEAGGKQIRVALLTVLAPEARLALAVGLNERGLKAEAVEQLELIRRTALPDSPPTASGAQFVGNIVSPQEPARAAECWEQLQLHVLNANSNFSEVEGYLSLSHIVHKMRAKASLAAGDADRVNAELERCDNVLPGDVRLIVDLVPKLKAAGMTASADTFFDRGLAVHQRVYEQFPASATYLNNAAWLCARSQRKLDEALALVERAIAIAPDEASYRDTLAEVHFQRGDREAAVAAAQRAAELSPENKLFATRLAHFQQDELKTLDGTEAE
jgi:tetratricopeptide (TPR) repeat protein